MSALSARSAAGLESACTAVSALSARSAVGAQSASTVVYALSARSAAGLQSASTVVSGISARSAVVHQSASTVVSAINARSAVGLESASTVVGALSARTVIAAREILVSNSITARSTTSSVHHIAVLRPDRRPRPRASRPLALPPRRQLARVEHLRRRPRLLPEKRRHRARPIRPTLRPLRRL